MLLLSSKEGTVRVLEDPDNSDDNFVIADLQKYMCHNGERGLQAIRPHPNFANNQFIYMFYARIRDGCLQDANQGPRNRLNDWGRWQSQPVLFTRSWTLARWYSKVER